MSFIIMVTLHLVADYPLQGDFLANFKGNNLFLLFVHSAIWTGVLSFGLMYLEIFCLWKVFFLLIGHMIIDKWKCTRKDKSKALTDYLYIDQLLHLLQIEIVLY